MTTIDLNKTLDELKFEFSDMTGFLQDAFSTGEESLTSIKNNINKSNKRSRLAKFQNIIGPNGIDGMTTNFSEAQNLLSKKSSSEIASNTAVAGTSKLAVYDNSLPFGLPAAGGINENLRDVKEKTWDNFSNYYGKIFRKIAKVDFEEMIKNPSIGQSGAKNIIHGTCGSLSEWPQINPKSAGLGRCSTLFQIFNKHYMEYTAGGTGLKVPDFYHDLISSLHTAEVYGLAGKNKPTTITGFSNKIDTYNINTDLWFLSDKDKEEAKYNGFSKTGADSYGKFFEIGGFPVASTEYVNVITHMTRYAGKIKYPSNDYDTFIRNTDALVNQLNGAFIRTSDNANETIIFNNRNLVIMGNVEIDDGGANYPSLNKIYCSLFLNQGNETNINQLEEMKYYYYLLNIRKYGRFPAICKFPQEIGPLQDRHGDILITQRDPEIGLLLFLRMVFEIEYPIERLNPAAPLGGGNETINIFENTANMITITGAHAPEGLTTTYNMTKYNDNLDVVKSKLKRQIDTLMQKFNGSPYYTEYIQNLLLKYIDDIEKAGSGVTYGAYPGSQAGNIYDGYFTPFIGNYNTAGIIQIFSQNQANLNFGNGNIVNLVQANRILAPYSTAPVKVYRHLVFRLMTHLNIKLIALQPVALDSNKYNLYNDNDAQVQALTSSKPTAGGIFNDLSNFKQLIPDVNPVMKGGKSKSINKIKIGGNKTKISSKKIQKGGARQTLFVDTVAAGNQGAPRLYANRRLQEFRPDLFKNAVKKYKELNFTSDYATVKTLFDKISHINSLPLFFDSYDNTRTRTIPTTGTGGCGVPPAGPNTTLSFSEVAQLFLFNCVNTTTTTLLIHFFKNVKACLNHFVSTDLKTAETNFGKDIGNQQSAKIEGSFRELNKELDKLINFLKYNTLNLQEQTINLNDNGGPVGGGGNPLFVYNANEHYIKNLFLGANVYFSYFPNANQFVVMRLTDTDIPAAGVGSVNWQGSLFFNLLNRIVSCTESSDDFTKTIQFLTDNKNDPAEYGLQNYLATLTGLPPLVNNRYLQKIRPHIKDKPDGCFGGIPFVSLDPKIYKLLMLSYYFLLKLRLVVGEESKKDQTIVEEEIFSELSIDKQREIIDIIKSKLSASAFSGLASSLTSNSTFKHAEMLFESFYLFLFNQSNRLIEQVKKAEQLTKESSKNKKKENLFSIKGGQSTSIYSRKPTTNSNNGNLLKKKIDFIKTKYQVSSEFDFIIETLTKQLTKQIELKKVRNNLHFFYYIVTHFRNFKIYMDTVLLTIGEKNIPPEVSQKLQQYVKYSPDKSKYKESFTSLKNSPLIDPQYSDPLWWASIERKFMSIQKQTNTSEDVVYRLFIITTTPTSGLKKLTLRDMYIVDAFNLATLNDDRSKIDQPSWFSTGYRTHAGIKSVLIEQKNAQGHKQMVYSDSNTVIKLTGIQIKDPTNKAFLRMNSVSIKKKLKNLYNKLPLSDTRRNNKKITESVIEAIHPNIISLIAGQYLYYDKHDNKYKKLVPLFLQGSTNTELLNILKYQQNLKYRPITQKFSDTLDYKIYQMEDEKIQKLKEYRKWLYMIFMEKQMSLEKPDDDVFTTNIQKTMKKAFNNFLGSNITGKCSRVYNIYDYRNGILLEPQPINPVKIKCSDFDNFDLGAYIINGFISRESLIKLMLLY